MWTKIAIVALVCAIGLGPEENRSRHGRPHLEDTIRHYSSMQGLLAVTASIASKGPWTTLMELQYGILVFVSSLPSVVVE
jgi:hypothetical protein